MKCEYCERDCPTSSSYHNHIRRCPKNGNRIMTAITPEGREKLRQSTTEKNKKKWSDPEFRLKHQASMKKAVLENPESYSSSNRGRTKQVIVDGIKLQGQWEVDFYLWAKAQGLNPKRPNIAFKYTWNGERLYHPDFYIETLDLYVEVKGYETDRDRAKWSQFPKTLRIIKAAEINQIRQGRFERL